MSTIDYAFKSEVLKSGLCERINKIDRALYNYYQNGVITNGFNPFDEYDKLLEEYDYTWIREARKINDAKYHRVERLQNRISNMLLFGNCLFITLTFRDNVLSDTSADTRKQYVRKWFKSFGSSYVANIDYGSKNEREHYHGIILFDRIDTKTWHYGFAKFKRVRDSKKDCKKLAKYVAKLTNHAIKSTNKRSVIIYSRNCA